jgi:uncharacterized protein
METPLPTFTYHPDPVATGSVVRTDEACEACDQVRGYIYTGPVYAVEEIELLCPWCIADGSAARDLGVTFGTVDGVPIDVPAEVLDEVLHRTPGFAGWQQERWLFHCSDGAQYQGRVGYEDVARLHGVVEMIAADGWDKDALRHMSADGDLTGYLFSCRHCSARLAYADCYAERHAPRTPAPRCDL